MWPSPVLICTGASLCVHLLRCMLRPMVNLFIVGISTSLCLIGGFDVEKFAQRLWGDIYFNEDQRKFTRKPTDPEANRSFVHFVMEPLYKLYSQVLSEETEALSETLAELGIRLKPVIYKMDVRPLLKVVLDQFFGPSRGLVDMIVEHIPNPVEGALDKVRLYLLCTYGETKLQSSTGGKDILGRTNFSTCYLNERMQS
jgi:hypothetical protein